MDSKEISFSDLGLSQALATRLSRQKIKSPTPIQKKSLPIALEGKDLIGIAQTGTGKTLAFVLPLLEKLVSEQEIKALILSPTREIAQQTFEVIQKLTRNLELKGEDVHASLIIGGKSLSAQIRQLQKNPQIVIATPGRLVDHMERKNIDAKIFNYVVLDEADHMLDLGFLPQVRTIMRSLPAERQTLMLSATFPHEIESLAKHYQKNPVQIRVKPPGTAAEGIEHALYLLDPENKRPAILKLIDPEESTLVFTRTKLDAEWLYRLLLNKGYEVHALHADRKQMQRNAALESFKKGKTKTLVATDIMARGIDVVGIAHVINFDIPHNADDYIHRVGRTARAKAKGRASTLATWMDKSHIEAIEAKLGSPLPRQEIAGIPAFKEVKVSPSSLGKIGRRGKRVRMR
ncbi:MAG: DEAD/DEAH box helicase [Deltaproteobacteria bacterium]|nr:DEAD/DEAH box helicase [Deltaproteobacteria bacterium]